MCVHIRCRLAEGKERADMWQHLLLFLHEAHHILGR